MLMLGGGMTVGAIVFSTTSWIATGSPNSDIETYAGGLVGFYLGVVIVALGLVGIGRWLTSE